MTSIAIYVEGGGDGRDGKAALRQGFDQLLAQHKDAARARRMVWRLVPCGSRGATFDAFRNALNKQTADLVVLLVDAEEAVEDSSPKGRVAHLERRDRWDFGKINREQVHLMTQCMEAWIVADGEKLAEFYGQGFREKVLPKRPLLDDEPKASLYSALENATKNTQKRSYGKIKHASELLKRIRPAVVSKRCNSFQQLTQWLNAVITGTHERH